LNSAILDIFDTALTVGVSGFVTPWPGLSIKLNGSLLGIAATDDPGAVVVIGRQISQSLRARFGVFALCLLELATHIVDFRPQKASEPVRISHCPVLDWLAQNPVGNRTQDCGRTVAMVAGFPDGVV